MAYPAFNSLEYAYLKKKRVVSATAITQRGYQTNIKDIYWKQNIAQQIAHRRFRVDPPALSGFSFLKPSDAVASLI